VLRDVVTSLRMVGDFTEGEKMEEQPKVDRKHPEGIPIPSHLAEWLGPLDWYADDPYIEGDLICPCGCRNLEFYYPGETHKPALLTQHIPVWIDVLDESGEVSFWFAIDVVCVDCQKRVVVFDNFRHGTTAFLADNYWEHQERPTMKKWVCSDCGGVSHHGRPHFRFDSLIEFLNENEGKCGADRWGDAFHWFGMKIECVNCGNRIHSWAGYESG